MQVAKTTFWNLWIALVDGEQTITKFVSMSFLIGF